MIDEILIVLKFLAFVISVSVFASIGWRVGAYIMSGKEISASQCAEHNAQRIVDLVTENAHIKARANKTEDELCESRRREGEMFREVNHLADKMIRANHQEAKLTAENERLEAELAQAKAAAVQWVTSETLPEEGKDVLLVARFDGCVRQACLCVVPEDGSDLGGGGTLKWRWADFANEEYWHQDVGPGDRWAYLPQPPAGVAI